MTLELIENEVKTYLLENFLPDEAPESLNESTPLVTSGVLDSLASLELVSFLEESYAIKVKAHEVNVDNLNTLADIATFVRSKRA